MTFVYFAGAILVILGLGYLVYGCSKIYKNISVKLGEITDTEKHITIKIEIYKVIAQIVVSFAVALGSFVAIYQLIQTREQIAFATKSQAFEVKHRRERLSLKRFENAINGLESAKVSKRTSAVLTINDIANEFPRRYGKNADDILIAFVRNGFSFEEYRRVRNNGGLWPTRDKRIAIEILSKRLGSNIKSVTKFSKLNLRGAVMPHLVAKSMIFSGSKFSHADMRGANLQRTEFNKTDLSFSNLSGAILIDAEFEESDLREVNFSNSSLKGAIFKNAKLIRARFNVAILNGANFRNANLSGANFIGAKMLKTDFSGANLSDVELLPQASLNQALGDKYTTLPSTLTRPSHWK